MVALVSPYVDATVDAQFCGGTLIAPDLVLTAAHCVTDFFGFPASPLDIEVVAGTKTLPVTRGKRIPVVGIVPHPQANLATLENDVALVKIGASLQGPFVRVASVLDSKLYETGTQAKVLGWGQQHPEAPRLPVRLQEGDVPVYSDLDCLDKIGRIYKPASMTCAAQLKDSGKDPVSACYGDSGGPLVVPESDGNFVQIGVVSWGFSCTAEFPGVFADVAALNAFITTPPIIAPYVLSTPVIEGTAKVGEVLTCNPGIWGGDKITGYYYQWQRNFSEIPGAFESTYRAEAADADQELVCVVTALNDGGSNVAYSAPVRVAPAEVAPPGDTIAPTAELRSFVCGKKSCTLQLFASDDGVIDAVESVRATVLIEKRAKCKKGKKRGKTECTVNTTTEADAVSEGNGRWKLTVKPYDRRKEALSISVRARDKAGNVQDPALTLNRKAKSSK